VLRNERPASRGVLGDSSAYVTALWASSQPTTATAAFYRRTHGARYGLHTEIDTAFHVTLSGFAPGQSASVRVEITTNRPNARLCDEQPAKLYAIPADTKSFSQVTVSSP
jgi:hypothetical protein